MRKAWIAIGALAAAALVAGCAGSPTREARKPLPPKAAQRGPVATLITVAVEGADYPTLTTFKQRLRGISGVRKIYQQSFDAQKTSLLQVEYVGAAQALADAIQRLSAEDMPVEVVQFDPTRVQVRIAPSM